ncbi:hypothetical protein [Streptomyces ochraceiscleroticus]|uniref:Integral membrane protein n=1 Tax=Streptomyces ochraceiscleroticus TaxID=47761 RepID=A0ABW1MMB3_9ACTN|nr:hypothetical protein [Streptomyces ochraceiscleroticus]
MHSPEGRAAADLRLLRAAVFTAACVALAAAGHMIGSCATVPLWTLGAGCVGVLAVAVPLAGRERTLPGIAVALAFGQLALHALFMVGQRGMAVQLPADGAQGLSDRAAIGLARQMTCGFGTGRLDAAEAREILAGAGIGPGAATHAAHDAAGNGMAMHEMAGHGTAGHDMAGHGTAGHDMAGHGTAGHGTAGHDMAVHGTTSTGSGLSAVVHHFDFGSLVGLLPSLPMLLGHLLAALAAGWLLRRGEAALWRLVRLSAPAAREAATAVTAALLGALRTALRLVCALCAGLLGAADTTPRASVSYGHDKARPEELVLQHSVVRRGPPRFALAA